MGEEGVDLRISPGGLISEGDDAIPEIPDGKHLKSTTKFRGAPAGVEGRDQVHGVICEPFERSAREAKGGPTAEKEDTWSELGCAGITGDLLLVGFDLAGQERGALGLYGRGHRRPRKIRFSVGRRI